jgi:PAS domain S-box-containing protein
MRKSPFTIIIVYFLIGALWVALGGLVLLTYSGSTEEASFFQHLKSILFIATAAVLFFYFTRLSFRFIKESDNRYQQLFNDNPQPMLIYRQADLKILDINKAATEKYEHERKTFLNLNMRNIIPIEDIPLLEQMASQAPPVRRLSDNLIVRHKKKSGELFYVQITSQQITYRGQPARLVLVLDIDAKHRAEQKVRRLNHKLKNIQEALSVSAIVLIISKEGAVQFANQQFISFFQSEPQQVLHKRYKYFCKALHPLQTARILAVVVKGAMWQGELKVINEAQQQLWIDTKIIPVKNEQQEIEEYIAIAYDITEKKQAQEELVRRERLFRSLVDSQTNYLVRIDLNGRYTYANDRFLQKFGYTLNELIGTHYHDTVIPDDVHKCREAEKFCKEKPEQITLLETRKPDKNGNIFWNSWEFVGIAGEDGQTTVVQGLGQDITPQRQAEEDLQKYTQRLDLVLDSIGEGFFTMDKSWRLLKVNREFERMVGRSKEELQNGYLLEVLPFMADAPFYPYLEATLEEGLNTYFEEYSSQLNKWLEVSLYPFQDGISGYFRDVTKKKKAELEVKQTLQRYDTLTKATYDTIWEWDLIRNTVKWSTGINRIFNYTEEEVENTHEWWEARLHPDDRERVVGGIFKHTEEKKGAWTAEYRFKTANGKYHYVFDRGYVIYGENQEPVRMIGAMQDISQQRQFQEEIQKLSLVARKTQNGVVITDKDGYIEWINESFSQLCGYKLEEVKGKKPGHFLQGPQSQPKVRENIRRMLKLKVDFSEEIMNYHKSGIPYWVRMDISPVFDEEGRLIKFIGIETDITERKRFEQRLQQQNDQLKEIAWISSHEIRGPVASILGLISLYDHSHPEAPFNKEILQHLEGVTKKLDVVIHRIVNKTYAVDEMQEEQQ